MLVKPMIDSWEVPRIDHISSGESRRRIATSSASSARIAGCSTDGLNRSTPWRADNPPRFLEWHRRPTQHSPVPDDLQ